MSTPYQQCAERDMFPHLFGIPDAVSPFDTAKFPYAGGKCDTQINQIDAHGKYLVAGGYLDC